MDAELKPSNPHKNTPIQQQAKCTREIEAEAPTAMRPAPAGQDSGESERPKGSRSSKSDPSMSSPRMTPRRFTNTGKLLKSQGSDEEKLAPLGFEPEGSAAATPPCEGWPSNFEDLLADSDAFGLFYEYLQQENCEHLLEFWRECDLFRQMAPTSHEMRASGKAIFQRFVHSRAESVLAIRDTTRSKVAQHVNDQPTSADLFDEALSEVIANMKNTHYSKFLNSNLWKKFGQFDVGGGGSPKGIYNRLPFNDRFHSSYLPTLPEEKVLGFDEIEEEQFEFDQLGKSSNGLSCNVRHGQNTRSLLHKPAKDMLAQCYFNPAPAASRMDSENQSLSSDALTDDTLSLGDSDCMSRHSGHRRHRGCSGLPRVPGFVPRTKRLPKGAKNPMPCDEFARVLTEKLEKVLLERELQGREATNLSASLQAEKSILQKAIENSQKQGKIPLRTMAMMATSYDSGAPSMSIASSQQDSSSAKSTTASVVAGSSTIQNSCSSGSTHRRSRRQHEIKPKAVETTEKTAESQHDGDFSHPSENVWENHSKKDDDIPFLPVNHSRIMKWIEEGSRCVAEETIKNSRHQRQQVHSSSPARSTSRSKQSSSSSRADKYSSSHKPNQPIAQDLMMPPLPQPEATTVLEEAKRRLIEKHENDRKSRHHKQRSRSSVDEVGSIDDGVSSYHGKRCASSCCCSATDCSSSSCAHSMLSYDLPRAVPASAASTISSSIRSSVSNAHSDPRSKDSGISASSRHKEKHNVTTVTYWLWGEPIAYRTSLPGNCVTLKQFKTLISRTGQFRYFFKSHTDDRDCDGVVYEEVKDDDAVLPSFDGKVVGKVEKVDS